MAQDLQNVADIAIDEAAIALRNNSILPMLVARDIGTEAQERNKVIQVPVWPAMNVNTVTPGPGNEGTDTDLNPDLVDVRLSEWKEVSFSINDKEMAEVADGRVLPNVMLRAVIAIADTINGFIGDKLRKAAWVNEAAASPGAVSDIINMRTKLNKNNVAKDNKRSLVLSDDMGGEFLQLPAFYSVEQVGETQALREGSLGRKFGFNIHEMNALTAQTAGDFDGTVNGIHTAAPGFSGGYSDIALNRTSGTLRAGDIVEFAGHTGAYSVIGAVVNGLISAETLAANGTVRVYPMLREDLADAEDVDYETATDSHAIGGLGFHESAMAFATRPLSAPAGAPGAVISQTTDPVSGLSLRLTVTYANHQARWAFDILYGGEVVYSEMIARLKD